MSEPVKPWYTSRTVWASMLQILVAALVAAGKLTHEGGQLMEGAGPDVITGLVTAALAAVALWGRVAATHRIG